jgi:WD40 repeat protein
VRHRLVRYVLIPLLVLIIVVGAVFLFQYKTQFGSATVTDDEKPVVYVQQGHSANALCVAWSPDGRRAISGDEVGIVKVWDVFNGKELYTIYAHPRSWVSAVAYLPDGEQFVTAGTDSMVRLWDSKTVSEVRQFRASSPVTAVAVSADGKRLIASAIDSLVRVWDITSGEEMRTLIVGHHGSPCAALTPDGRRALTQGTENGTLALWDVDSGKRLYQWKLSSGEPLCAAFSSDGLHAVCGCGTQSSYLVRFAEWDRSKEQDRDSYSVDIWDARTGVKIRSMPTHVSGVTALKFIPFHDEFLTCGLDSTLKLWDLHTGSLLQQFPNQRCLIGAVDISPDARHALSVGADCVILLWDIRRNTLAGTLGGLARLPFASVLSEEGHIYTGVRGKEDYSLALWDFGPALALWDTRSGRRISFSDYSDAEASGFIWPDPTRGMYVVDTTASGKAIIQFWNKNEGSSAHCTTEMELPILGCVLSQDNLHAVTLSEDSVFTLWDVRTGREVESTSNPLPPNWSRHIYAFNWSLSRDGYHALIYQFGSSDMLYSDFSTGETSSIHNDNVSANVWSARLFMDAERGLVARSNGIVEHWNLKQKRVLRSFRVDTEIVCELLSNSERWFAGALLYNTYVSNICSDSVRGSWVTTGSEMGIWDTETGRKLHGFIGHRGFLGSINVSSDDQRIVSTANDGTTRVWNVETGKEIVQFISFVNGEWVAVTPEGYYTASVNGDAFLNVRTGNKITGIEPYRSTFYQPAVVEAALRLGDSEKAISEVMGCESSCTTIADLPEMAPPLVVVRYPDDGDTLQTQDTTLSFHVEDWRNVIQSVKVFVNGRPVRGETMRGAEETTTGMQLDIPKEKKALDLSVPIRLDEGDNLITITAMERLKLWIAFTSFSKPNLGLTSKQRLAQCGFWPSG